MLLRTRNRIYLVFSFFSAAAFLLLTALFIFGFLNHSVFLPEKTIRLFPLFNGGIFNYNFICTIISIFIISAYIPIVSFILYFGFEKTQSMEIIYFIGFLSGFFLEQVRMLMCLNGLWETDSFLLILTGRIIIAGRLMAVLSFLFSAALNGTEQRQNVEQNLLIILVLSISTGLFIPLDTNSITTTGMVLWGFRKTFNMVKIFIILCTALSFLINSFKKESNSYIRQCIGFLITIAGYNILCSADNIVFLITGTAFLIAGTFEYLKAIHNLYMWR